MEINGQVAVITGAGKGLGRLLAEYLNQAGASVLISDIGQENLNQTAEELNLPAIVADVSQEEDINNLANEALSRFGRIDIWINNAGIWLPRLSVTELKPAAIRQVFAVNVYGSIYGTIAALKQMQKQESGTIINIISVSALSGRPLSAAYSASKHAVKGFTDSLRTELTDSPIKVIATYPPGMKTDLFNAGRPVDFAEYLEPEIVAKKIVDNLKQNKPVEDLMFDDCDRELRE
ncbi:MAG: SDR family oxidoreductase [Candidatus Paceibacterota bacterium]